MPIAVYTTSFADLQIGQLRSRDRQAFDLFVNDLGHRGCAALGYRLSGPRPVNEICVKHLPGLLRAVVGFKTYDEAWILLLGPHVRDDPGVDVYTLLYELVGIEPPDDARRTKPPCCDADTGLPAELEAALDELVDRARQLAGARRRR